METDNCTQLDVWPGGIGQCLYSKEFIVCELGEESKGIYCVNCESVFKYTSQSLSNI